MPVRYHAQRQHIIRSLDQILYQLDTVSFLLSPALLPFLSRVLFQFQFAKPREIDPDRSLRFWFFLVLVFNFGSVWTHVLEPPAEQHSILLDFVGPASIPSRLQLILLDVAIILLDMLLAAISYETALYEASPKDTPDVLLPIPPLSEPPSPLPLHSSPPLSPLQEETADAHPYQYPPKTSDQSSPSTNQQSPYVMDLRLHTIYRRLRDPKPPSPERQARLDTEDLLPLPNTTPFQLSGTLQMLLRVRARARERARREREGEGEGRRTGGRTARPAATQTQTQAQTVPGGLDDVGAGS